MLKFSLAVGSLRLATGIATFALAVGCGPSIEDQLFGEQAPEKEEVATQTPPSNQESLTSGSVIVSDGPITVENGKITYGPPEVTEDVEKEIYKKLSFQLNVARGIEERVPGGNRSSRETREVYELVKKGFMRRYDISESDIASILRKGAEQGWDDGMSR